MEGMGQWPLLIMMFLAFYFILIVPQTRRAKKEKIYKCSKRGDRVVTKSGMHGKVIEVNDANNSCVIETMAGKIKFDKTAISLEMSSKLNKK